MQSRRCVTASHPPAPMQCCLLAVAVYTNIVMEDGGGGGGEGKAVDHCRVKPISPANFVQDCSFTLIDLHILAGPWPSLQTAL